MTRQEGLVIENDSSYYLYGTAQTCLLPNLSSNEITAGVTDGMHVLPGDGHCEGRQHR